MASTRDRFASRCAQLAQLLESRKPEDVERVRRELARMGAAA